MDRQVFLVTHTEEVFLGSVKEVLRQKASKLLAVALRDIVDDMIFSDDGADYTVLTIEVR